jgi:polyribonucleotide nucleotidyltransferase
VANGRVGKVEDVLKLGDVVKVKVIEVDEEGKISLDRLDKPDAPEGSAPRQRHERRNGERHGNGRGNGGNNHGEHRNRRPGDFNRGNGDSHRTPRHRLNGEGSNRQ